MLMGSAASTVPTPPPGSPSARVTEAAVRQDLTQRLAGAPAGSTARIVKAVAALGKALDAANWSQVSLDGNHVSPSRGSVVFAQTRRAVQELAQLRPGPPSWAITDMTHLDYAARLIATTAISESACGGTDGGDRSRKARRELAKGDATFGKARYADAVKRYGKAWKYALAAKRKTPGKHEKHKQGKTTKHGGGAAGCVTPGLIVSPGGAPGFTVTRLVPRDVASLHGITVQVTGSQSAVTGLYTRDRAGSLLPALNLAILDTTTGLTVYSGPLNGLSSSPSSPQRICAVGSTDTGPGCIAAWRAGELHTFTFTVSFPSRGSADNAFQGTGGSLTFVWGRS